MRMGNYYDPPEDPNEEYYLWLDAAKSSPDELDFYDKAEDLVHALTDLKRKMRDALIQEFGFTVAAAEDVVEWWWYDKI